MADEEKETIGPIIEHVKEFVQNIESLGIKGDAVCTKYPELWD